MARQHIDIVALRKKAPLAYAFEVGRFAYRLRFEDGAWMLDQLRRDAARGEEAHVRTVEVESFADGVNWALEDEA